MRAMLAIAVLGVQGCVTRRYCDGQTAAIGKQCVDTIDQLGRKCAGTVTTAMDAADYCFNELGLCQAAKGVWGPTPRDTRGFKAAAARAVRGTDAEICEAFLSYEMADKKLEAVFCPKKP